MMVLTTDVPGRFSKLNDLHSFSEICAVTVILLFIRKLLFRKITLQSGHSSNRKEKAVVYFREVRRSNFFKM